MGGSALEHLAWRLFAGSKPYQGVQPKSSAGGTLGFAAELGRKRHFHVDVGEVKGSEWLLLQLFKTVVFD